MLLYLKVKSIDEVVTENEEERSVIDEVMLIAERKVLNYEVIPYGELGEIIEYVKEHY